MYTTITTYGLSSMGLLLVIYTFLLKLKNCFTLADGSNLRYVLYNKCTTINSAYGGDYKKYYDCVSAFANK